MLNTLLLIGVLSSPDLAQFRSPDLERQLAQLRATLAEHENRDQLNHATWTYIASAAADWSVTLVCYRVTCGDYPQTGLFLYHVKPAVAGPIGLAIDATVVMAVRQFLGDDHPKLARAVLYGLSAARVVVLANHVNVLRRDARRVPYYRPESY